MCKAFFGKIAKSIKEMGGGGSGSLGAPPTLGQLLLGADAGPATSPCSCTKPCPAERTAEEDELYWKPSSRTCYTVEEAKDYYTITGIYAVQVSAAGLARQTRGW